MAGVDKVASEQLLERLSSGHFSDLPSLCEDVELELAELSTPHENAALLRAAHFLAYLLVDDLQNARFLWKRTPEALRTHAHVVRSHDLLKLRWAGKHAEFFDNIKVGVSQCSISPQLVEVAACGQSHSKLRWSDQLGVDTWLMPVWRVRRNLSGEHPTRSRVCFVRCL